MNKKSKSYYTTPEQSKKLLELGLPSNSADCYNVIDSDVYNKDDIRVRQNDYEISSSFFNNKHYNPCWSVGKLQEIFDICNEDYIERSMSYRIEYMIALFELEKENDMLNFSKLELEY